ncbi:Adenylate kinase [Buchnera aphidicola (Thelaxes suberi)]|uniref:adenylate kinase family protein n=1 Tax=Buchnera aphidicola TaxID=9 RepID=UPI00346443C3
MHIILLGAPGSGKGTQSHLISKKLNLPIISTSYLLKKQSLYSSKKENIIINNCIQNGILVPDNIVINLIKKRITKKDCKTGYILDGFPRTIKQADSMESANIFINCVIEIIVDEKTLIKRISGRRVHTQSGRIYHTIFSPPIIKNKDDLTGEKLIIRSDDNPKTIKKRIEEYNKTKVCLINFFKKRNKVFQINGNQSIEKIHQDIVDII